MACTEGSQLLADLAHIHAFMDSQKQVQKQEAWDKMVNNQAVAWQLRIQSANITMEEATNLTKVFAQGPWSEDHLAKFGALLADQLTNAKSPPRRPNQSITAFGAYLTDSDLATLSDDSVHYVIKVQALVDRCFVLQLHLPSEVAIKHIIKTAIDCGVVSSKKAGFLSSVQSLYSFNSMFFVSLIS